MKKIVFVFSIFVIVILVYYFTVDKNIYYLSLGNSGYSYYIKDYYKERGKLEKYVSSYSDDMIIDLINKIDNNYKFNDIYLKNALVKADLITFSINVEDMRYRSNYDLYSYVDSFSSDFSNLLKKIRYYSKEDIVFVGPSGKWLDDDLVEYFNLRILNVCKKYNVIYIDNFDLDNNVDKIISFRIIDALKKRT